MEHDGNLIAAFGLGAVLEMVLFTAFQIAMVRAVHNWPREDSPLLSYSYGPCDIEEDGCCIEPFE